MRLEPFLIVVRLVEGEWSARMGRKRGRGSKEGREEQSRGHSARLPRVCPARLREEGGREM